VPIQRIKINGLGLPVKLIDIALFSTAAGQPNITPVGSLIASALEAGDIDERFSQIDAMLIGFLPIIAQVLKRKSQHLGCKIFYPNPRQNQKTGVVGDEIKTLTSNSGGPADIIVTTLDFEGRAGPGQTGNNLAIKIDQISEMFTNKFGQPQVMIMVKQIAP